MLTRYITWTFLAVFALFTFTTAEAANLTSKQVENYIKTVKTLNETDFDLAEDLDETYDFEDYFKSGLPKIEDMVKNHKNTSEIKEVEKIVKRHGFKNITEWAQAGDKINAATLALMFEEENVDLQNELDKAKKELEDMPWLTDEQKEAMLGFALGAANLVNNWIGDVPERDKKVVKPYLQQLMEIMGDDDD